LQLITVNLHFKFTAWIKNNWLSPPAVLAIVAYIPNLLDSPGKLAADNKLYLFLDPLRFLRQVAFMWDPSGGLGTVTFQHVGYLLPLGPFYSFFYVIHVPAWVAQRIWTGSLLYFAGLGVYYFLKNLAYTNTTSFIASISYMLSPYSLQYLNRISDILLPYSALGWMMGLTLKATRSASWRYPLAFAVIVAIIGGTNGSSLIYAGAGPLSFLIYTIISKKSEIALCIKAFIRIAILSFLVSIWWLVALLIDSHWGINILKFTETVPAVASTSTASETIRGLGYWFYYGTNAQGPWATSSVGYQEHIWLIFISFLIPTLSIVAASLLRFIYRGYFIILLTIGLIAAVGTYPFYSPSIWGYLLRYFMLYTTPGFALRSTDRATPLVILSLAVFLGIGAQFLVTRLRPAFSRTVIPLLSILIVLNYPSLFDGQLITPQYEMPSSLPGYYYKAASYLQARGNSTRYMVIPGADTATYRWGTTVDPIFPGLTSRPSTERQQLPEGTYPSIDLMDAFDDQFQEDTVDPASIAPVARLMSVGDIVVQSELTYEVYNLPDPRVLWSELKPTPRQLFKPKAFGTPVANLPSPGEHVVLGEQTLPGYSKLPWPAPLEDFKVSDPRPLIRPEAATSDLIIDGGGSGIIEAGATDLLNNSPTVFYSGTLDTMNPSQRAQILNPTSTLVLTDTNRKQARRWAGTIVDTLGEIETASQRPNPSDYSNAPLDLFPNAGSSAQTYTILQGVKSVSASVYGNQVTYQVGERPALALDNNSDTAWQYSPLAYPPGQYWEVKFLTPVTTNKITVSQLTQGNPTYYISKIRLVLNTHTGYNYALNKSSLQPSGQTLYFPEKTFSGLKIIVMALKKTGNTGGTDNVGFSEVNVNGISAVEVVKTPSDLMESLGASNLSHRLVILLSRFRVGNQLGEDQPESTIIRDVYLPTARSFFVSGTATLSDQAPDETIDSVLGLPGSDGTGYVARSSGRAPGVAFSRASSAFDDNLNTAWEPGSGYTQQIGSWIELDAPKPVSFNYLNLVLANDREHSIPTQIEVSSEEGIRLVNLPKIHQTNKVSSYVRVRVNFATLVGKRIRITIKAIKPTNATTAPNNPYFTLPISIIEAGIPGVTLPALPTNLPDKCYNNLIAYNGVPSSSQMASGIPIPVRITGTTLNAQNELEMHFISCHKEPVELQAGDNLIDTSNGSITGWDINTINLDSAPYGGPNPVDSNNLVSATAAGISKVKVVSESIQNTTVKVHLENKGNSGFWFVYGTSYDSGWEAIVNGKDIGTPTLIDGYANGWYINSSAKTLDITLYFYPQTFFNMFLILGALVLLLALIGFFLTFLKVKPPKKLPVVFQSSLIDPFSKKASGFGFSLLKRIVLLITLSIVALFFTTVPVSVAILFVLLFVLFTRYGSLLLTAAAPILFLTTDIWVTLRQLIFRIPANGTWPAQFSLGNWLILSGVFFLILSLFFEHRQSAGR
jgi:arabinofuranan 3-O-arabinosyltransferase